MKKLLFCVFLAATPRLALAQPTPKVQPPAVTPPAAPVIDEKTVQKIKDALQKVQTQIPFALRLAFFSNADNREAIALMGSFYTSFSRATSCREHMIMTQTTRENGRVTLMQRLELDGVWRRKDRFSDNYLCNMKINLDSVPAQGEAYSFEGVEVNDGDVTRRYYLNRPEWGTVPKDQMSPASMVVAAPALSWLITLMRVPAQPSFKVKNEADGTTLVSSSNGFYDAVYNADGTLRSLTSKDEDGSIAELRFEKYQINAPVTDEELAWKVVAGAKEVTLETGKMAFNFNFSLEKENTQTQTPAVATAPGIIPAPPIPGQPGELRR